MKLLAIIAWMMEGGREGRKEGRREGEGGRKREGGRGREGRSGGTSGRDRRETRLVTH